MIKTRSNLVVSLILCGAMTLSTTVTAAGNVASKAVTRTSEVVGVSLSTPLSDVETLMKTALQGAAVEVENLGGPHRYTSLRFDGALVEEMVVIYPSGNATSQPFQIQLWRTAKAPSAWATVSSIQAALNEKFGIPRGITRREFNPSIKDVIPKGAKAFLYRMLWASAGKVLDLDQAGCNGDQACGEMYIYGEIVSFEVPGSKEPEMAYFSGIQLVDSKVTSRIREERTGKSPAKKQTNF